MKSRALIASIFIGLLLITSTSMAAEKNGPYIGVAGGVSFFHDSDIEVTGEGSVSSSYDPGFVFGASLGYKLSPVRFEFEFGYRKADMDEVAGFTVTRDVSLRVMSYMVNVLFDINTNSPFTPYIGAGAGLLNGELEVNDSKEDTNEFGYQLIAGIAYNFNKNFALDLSYRFQHAPNDFSKDNTSIEYMSSNIMMGLRYTF